MEEIADGKYRIKFSWNAETRPPVVDTEGTIITDERTPVYSGSKQNLPSIKSRTSSEMELPTV